MHSGSEIDIKIAQQCERNEVKCLFMEYEVSLCVDLSFQDFEAELNGLPGDYQLPKGVILIAKIGSEIVGCACLRKRSELASELKRFYVRPCFRGKRLGKALLESVTDYAEKLGYESIYLDTLPQMKAARALYEQYGFEPVSPYYESPISGTSFYRYKCS